jgi:iron complex transport system substrate-binding protein
MNPDLIVANTGMSNTSRQTIQAAGIPLVLEVTGTLSRVNTIVNNFGLILNNPTKAALINSNAEYYTNLVEQRVQNLSVAQRTRFYYENSRLWYSCANGSSPNSVLTSCGGVNIAAASTVSYPQLTAEFVAESNPDIILYSITGTTNITNYKNIYDGIVSRAALQDTNALKTGRVYVYYYYLVSAIRYPVGELYFAKWFYPNLFADIDPAAIQAKLIQDYFGTTLTGTYTYSSADAAKSTSSAMLLTSVITPTASDGIGYQSAVMAVSECKPEWLIPTSVQPYTKGSSLEN